MLIILLYRMPDYSKSKIYKITGGGLTYIGSTTQTLSRRLSHHRSSKRDNPYYNVTSYPLLDFEDCCITLIEDVPCERKEQLHMRERYHIENTECVNKKIPLRTVKEWRETNRDLCFNQHKKWISENKEKSIINGREYYKKNKEKINQQKRERYALKKLQKETA